MMYVFCVTAGECRQERRHSSMAHPTHSASRHHTGPGQEDHWGELGGLKLGRGHVSHFTRGGGGQDGVCAVGGQ